ncbi:unnamed protein product [Microthlaspi erraticum]|uniref:Aminoacyl-tRNA synthetase class II (D/K/N) domain-containing protein n=1 Tax=Microthlaspi erraticum TaxID=1685480 RepID=A0A6D2IH15_9BRAS|nr:unnamed protein product [Microthlaspi erraticum]CAA7039672.1 unnamed protein product [Microthlaspi erraticum]
MSLERRHTDSLVKWVFDKSTLLSSSQQVIAKVLFLVGYNWKALLVPKLRAENSHTSRHLADFWMVEAEIASADLEDDMNCAEAYVKYRYKWLLEKC